MADDHRAQDAPARDPFVRKVATVVAITALAALLSALFILGIDILLAAFGGVLFAVLLRAFTNFLTRYTPLPDGWALATVLLLLSAVLVGGGWLLAPQISEQVTGLQERIPEIRQEIEGFLQQYGWGQWILEQARDGGEAMPEGSAAGIGSFFGALSRWSTYLLTAFFVGLFAAANPALYTDGIVHLFPLRHRPRVRQLIGEIGYTLRWWLIGQAMAMILIGVSTTIVLLVFAVPLAIVLGIIVGLLGFVPYLGPIIGGVPVLAIAATEGPSTLLYVLIAYTGVQLLEGYVATPLIQHRMVYLPPVMTIVIQILLGTLLGILGFVLATPLAAVVLVLTKYYRTDILGDLEAQEDEEEGEQRKRREGGRG